MSAATEYAPVALIEPRPAQSRPALALVPRLDDATGTGECAVLLATVTPLHALPARDSAPAVRLTRRGAVVLAVAVALVSAVLVSLAGRSGPGAEPPAPRSPATVVVQAGDTLWSIATRVAPKSDPRAVIDRLQSVNGLSGAQLSPGEVLRVR